MNADSLSRLLTQETLAGYAQARHDFRHAEEERDPALLGRAFELIVCYETLSSRLYHLRAELGASDPLRRRAEDFVAEASQEIISLQKEAPPRDRGYAAWVARYRTIWRENFSLFLFTLLVFITLAIAAWNVVSRDPTSAAAILPRQTLESVITRHKWFEGIQAAPLIEGFQIASNNIRVAFRCFLFGAFLGLGGLLVLGYNGLMLGAIIAFCEAHGFGLEIMTFMTGHGALELTIIVASAFASFLFGRVFYMRPYSLFRVRFRLAASDAGVVIAGVLPWLVLAACIEVFVSPWPSFSLTARLLISSSAAAAFWTWTLWPQPNQG